MTRRTPLLAVAIGLTLAACGTSDPAATTTPDATTPSPTEAAPTNDSPDEPSATDTEPADDEPPAEPSTTEPIETDAAAETPAPETPATEPPTAEPAPLGGRTFSTAVESDAQFDGNPFPDLVVDDVGRDGEANIANILPSDRPVLLWTWAPH
ncbi:MAG: hypothetical protein GKR86_13200 [Ilumatobacter sp.]|nr:hypothetical protein [Ilumatobacter sp.]